MFIAVAKCLRLQKAGAEVAQIQPNIEIVKLLLRQPNLDINCKNSSGIPNGPTGLSVLYVAVEIDDFVDVIDLMLKNYKDIDINSQLDDGLSVLSSAIQKGNIEIVRRLLKHEDIDVNLADNYGMTPLMYAIRGQAKLVKLLLAHKSIDVNLALEGCTSLHYNPGKTRHCPDSVVL